jgi:hypothetical protein
MIHNERIWGDTSPYFCYGIWQVLLIFTLVCLTVFVTLEYGRAISSHFILNYSSYYHGIH